MKYILFPTKVNLENEVNLYSASSNPTYVLMTQHFFQYTTPQN